MQAWSLGSRQSRHRYNLNGKIGVWLVYSNQYLDKKVIMKNIILGVLLATIGLVSCSSCATKSPPAPEPAPTPTVVVVPDAGPDVAPPVTTTVKVDGEGWEVTLPDNGWEVQSACKPDGACLTLMANDDRMNLMLMLRKANDSTMEEFTLKQVRSAKDSGAIIKSTKQVSLNGHNFVLLEATKDNAKVYVWITLSKGIGYEFSCGGPNDDGRQDKLCPGVSSSLKIK